MPHGIDDSGAYQAAASCCTDTVVDFQLDPSVVSSDVIVCDDCIPVTNESVGVERTITLPTNVKREMCCKWADSVDPDIWVPNLDWCHVDFKHNCSDSDNFTLCPLGRGTVAVVSVAEIGKSVGISVTFDVNHECFEGVCLCEYYLLDSRITLKPCRVFSECFLRGSIDENWEYMLKGSCFGFRVVDPDCPCAYSVDNYNSILKDNNHEFMSKKLLTEMEQGKVFVTDVEPKCVHALGAVFKKQEPWEEGPPQIRPITDCSRGGPGFESVNEHSAQVTTKFSYKTVDDVCDLMTPNSFLSTVDISDAYRGVHIYYEDRMYQGIRWNFNDGQGDKVMLDTRLCFGLSSGPSVFNAISEFIVRCLSRRGFGAVINYLDDFIVVYPTLSECAAAQCCLISVIRQLGFGISYKKVSGVATQVRYLGIDFDSEIMELRLPKDKMDRLLERLRWAEGKMKLTKKELQSVTGILAHASKVVKGGRTFTRNLYNMLHKVKKQHHKIRLSAVARGDITWWLSFAEQFNGGKKIITASGYSTAVYSDSSTSVGFAAYHDADWLAGFWNPKKDDCANESGFGHHLESPPTPEEQCSNINEMEFWPVLCAIKKWGDKWKDTEVFFVTDNTQVLHMINSGRSSNQLCMGWIRQLFWLSVTHNFHPKSVYIRSEHNVICDALSRWGTKDQRDRLLYATSPDSLCCYNFL